MLQKIEIEIEFIRRLLGSIPKDPKVFENFIFKPNEEEIKKEKEKRKELKLNDSDIDELLTIPIDTNNSTISSFHKNPNIENPCIMGYHIKGFLKNAGNIMKDAIGIKNLRIKINNFVSIEDEFIPLSNPIEGLYTRTIRGMTAMGERIVVKGSDYVESGTKAKFTLILINNKEVTTEIIKQLFLFAECNIGLGERRNDGFGRFKIINFNIIK